jgi:hypothetical protein
MGSFQNSPPYLSSHELCESGYAFVCETQQGSNAAMGLNPHVGMAEVVWRAPCHAWPWLLTD